MLARDFETAVDEHDYEQVGEKLYRCRVCGHTVKRLGSGGVCIGVPIYRRWDDIPEMMATKTTLSRDHKKKLAPGQKPVGAKMKFDRKGRFGGHYYALYEIADAVEKKAATSAQIAALEKAQKQSAKVTVTCQTCGRDKERNRYGDPYKVTRKQYDANPDYRMWMCHICKDRTEAKLWAAGLLADGDFVILDTETTNLNGEIVEIGIVDGGGNVLLDQRIKPQGEISSGAYYTHGIALEDLQNEPTFPQVYEDIKTLLTGRKVIIYNADFDTRILHGDCQRHGLTDIDFMPACAMLMYAQWFGEWSDYHKGYRWQPLLGSHGAVGDCVATLNVLKEMIGDG